MRFAKSRKRFARGGRPAYLRDRLITSARAVTLAGVVASDGLMKPKAPYHGHRFPPAIISQVVRWYFRFQPSLRDIEELLFERGVIVSYEKLLDVA